MDTPQTGIELIAAERKRQVEEEGWTVEHDDQHTGAELAYAAIAYAMESANVNWARSYWPWQNGFRPKDRISNLVRAGALIAAEIDRLQRMTDTDT